jgi:hypothetical protein
VWLLGFFRGWWLDSKSEHVRHRSFYDLASEITYYHSAIVTGPLKFKGRECKILCDDGRDVNVTSQKEHEGWRSCDSHLGKYNLLQVFQGWVGGVRLRGHELNSNQEVERREHIAYFHR